jgi:hypothetical protein
MTRLEIIKELQRNGYTVWRDSYTSRRSILLVWKVGPNASALLSYHGEFRDAQGRYLPSSTLSPSPGREKALALLRALLLELEPED